MPLYHIVFPLYIGSTQYLTVEQSSMLWAYNGTCIQYPYYPLVNSHNYVKSPPATGKSTINGPCFNSYVSLPEDINETGLSLLPAPMLQLQPWAAHVWAEASVERHAKFTHVAVAQWKASVTGFGNQTWLAGKSSQLHKCGSYWENHRKKWSIFQQTMLDSHAEGKGNDCSGKSMFFMRISFYKCFINTIPHPMTQ